MSRVPSEHTIVCADASTRDSETRYADSLVLSRVDLRFCSERVLPVARIF